MKQHERTAGHEPFAQAIQQPILLVASLDGDVALVKATTGAVPWHVHSGREVGTLAHDGARYFVALGSRLRLLREWRNETPDQRRQRHDRIRAEPAWLEARGVEDSRLLWRRADWDLKGRLDVGVGDGTVVVASTSMYGDRALYGLDARTGATVWMTPTTGGWQVDGHRFVVRAGRVYLYGESVESGLLVLQTRTGQRLWGRDTPSDLVISSRGDIVIEQWWSPDGTLLLQSLDPTTGAARYAHPLDGVIRVVSDDGIAYRSTSTFDAPGIVALRLEDGRELWRVDDIQAHQLVTGENSLYCAHLDEQYGVGEVEALDARTGQRLWRWRTPADPRALAALWGARMPRILMDAALRAGATIAGIMAQPSPRDIGIDLMHEFSHGQWRRPHAMHSAINAMWLAAGWGAVHLGTRLGIFALRASDGQLLWHALPTTDLSFMAPALSPVEHA